MINKEKQTQTKSTWVEGFNHYHTPWGEKDRSKCYKFIYLPKGGKKQKKQRL